MELDKALILAQFSLSNMPPLIKVAWVVYAITVVILFFGILASAGVGTESSYNIFAYASVIVILSCAMILGTRMFTPTTAELTVTTPKSEATQPKDSRAVPTPNPQPTPSPEVPKDLSICFEKGSCVLVPSK